MPIAMGLLVLTLLGADGSLVPDPTPLDYQIRILDMKGLDWRGAVHDRLSPVARQGGTTVWTAEQGLAAELTSKAEQIATTPRIRALPGALTEVRDKARQGIVADLIRVADGPIGQATTVAFQPQIDQVRLGFHARLSCRELDQGVLAKVRLEDSRLTAIHMATVHEDLKSNGNTEFNAQYQVPEVVQASAEGEWLIPYNGALVVGFGPHTTADAKGLAVVYERVVLIEARTASLSGEETPTNPLTDPHATTAVYLSTEPAASTPRPARSSARRVMVASPLPFPILGALPGWVFLPIHLPATQTESTAKTTETLPLPTPEPPSRILPTPRAADGTVTELPPLPDNDARPAALEESKVPRPSPQSPARTTPRAGSKGAKVPDHGDAGQPAPPVSRTSSPGTGPEANLAPSAFSSRSAPVRAVDDSVVKTRRLDAEGYHMLPGSDFPRANTQVAMHRTAAAALLHQTEAACPAPTGCEFQAMTDCQTVATIRGSLAEVNWLIEMLTDRDANGIKDDNGHKLGCIDVSKSDCAVKPANHESCVNKPSAGVKVQIKDRQGDSQFTVPMGLGSVSNPPLTVRIPLGGGEVMEIRASVVRLSAEPSECCAGEK